MKNTAMMSPGNPCRLAVLVVGILIALSGAGPTRGAGEHNTSPGSGFLGSTPLDVAPENLFNPAPDGTRYDAVSPTFEGSALAWDWTIRQGLFPMRVGCDGSHYDPHDDSRGYRLVAAEAAGEVEPAGTHDPESTTPPEPSPSSAEMEHRHAERDVTCADCHAEDPPQRRPPSKRCSDCHGDYEAVSILTRNVFPNPHESHVGEIRCTRCHKEHAPSELYCNKCHVFELVVP